MSSRGERWTVCRLVWGMRRVKVLLVRAVRRWLPSHANTEHRWRGSVCVRVCVCESESLIPSLPNGRLRRQPSPTVLWSDDWLKCDHVCHFLYRCYVVYIQRATADGEPERKIDYIRAVDPKMDPVYRRVCAPCTLVEPCRWNRSPAEVDSGVTLDNTPVTYFSKVGQTTFKPDKAGNGWTSSALCLTALSAAPHERCSDFVLCC